MVNCDYAAEGCVAVTFVAAGVGSVAGVPPGSDCSRLATCQRARTTSLSAKEARTMLSGTSTALRPRRTSSAIPARSAQGLPDSEIM
jgi:hypothetical protein